MTALARAVLRSAVGESNYAQLEAICEALTRLEMAATLSAGASDRILEALAEELTGQAAARDAARKGVKRRPSSFNPQLKNSMTLSRNP
jgi:hypothetical protein